MIAESPCVSEGCSKSVPSDEKLPQPDPEKCYHIGTAEVRGTDLHLVHQPCWSSLYVLAEWSVESQSYKVFCGKTGVLGDSLSWFEFLLL